MEEDLICGTCNGTGHIVEEDGRLDVCSECMGLGTVKGIYRPGPLSPTKIKIRRAFILTFLALAVYYALFTYSFIRFSLTPVATIIILLVGHMAAVTFLVAFLLSRSIREGT